MSDVIYDDGKGVRIDRGTAVIFGKTYSIANINSVSIEGEPPKDQKKGCGCLLLIGGLLLLMAAIGTLSDQAGTEDPVGYGLFAVLLIAAGIFLLRAPGPPTNWRLVFVMSNGTVEAISSTDRSVVERVKEAIETAIRSIARDRGTSVAPTVG